MSSVRPVLQDREDAYRALIKRQKAAVRAVSTHSAVSAVNAVSTPRPASVQVWGDKPARVMPSTLPSNKDMPLSLKRDGYCPCLIKYEAGYYLCTQAVTFGGDLCAHHENEQHRGVKLCRASFVCSPNSTPVSTPTSTPVASPVDASRRRPMKIMPTQSAEHARVESARVEPISYAKILTHADNPERKTLLKPDSPAFVPIELTKQLTSLASKSWADDVEDEENGVVSAPNVLNAPSVLNAPNTPDESLAPIVLEAPKRKRGKRGGRKKTVSFKSM